MWSSEMLLSMGIRSLLTSPQVESLVQDAVFKEGDFQTRSSPYSGQKPSRTLSESLMKCGVKQTDLGREGSKYGMDEYL
ncbi:unnamed protein product [Brassica napus]|uniref:(rape) hypothetical protein n=1 Tax=Brassica napus TaxID=3708 RepID=A0A816Z0E3_BRANA|nr:unnamed protein product [Brassica napus]